MQIKEFLWYNILITNCFSLDSVTDSMDMNLSKLQETVKDREAGVLQSMES